MVEGEPELVDRHREMVRLGAGLDDRGQLNRAAQQRALDCLERFGQSLRGMPEDAVRAVGTNTLRAARRAKDFRRKAEEALGHRIEVIAGREEARLIYLGVAHTLADDNTRRLVLDIGGGSTELILGERFEATRVESLFMGCVSYARRYFKGGRITRKNWQKARLAASQELAPVVDLVARDGWDDAIGASGTIRSTEAVIQAQDWNGGKISAKNLRRLQDKLIELGHVDELNLPGLKKERSDVFASGVTILQALVEDLGIKHLGTSPGALREGLLYDMLGRRSHEDVRERSVQQLLSRYAVDPVQATRVEQSAVYLFEESKTGKLIKLPEARQHLIWAAQLHEVGRAVAYRHFHRHGAYLLAHSDLPGFSADAQSLLAYLVSAQRRKFPDPEQAGLPERDAPDALRLALLLRLATLLNRSHLPLDTGSWQLGWRGMDLELSCPQSWLDQNTLTRMDLEALTQTLSTARVGFVLIEQP